MNLNIKGSTVVKTMALAGALSVGVLLSGHNSEAAGFGKHDNHHVKGYSTTISVHEKGSTHHIAVKPKVNVHVAKVNTPEKQIKMVKPIVKKVESDIQPKQQNEVKVNPSAVNKLHSKAAEHACETAKLHASSHSAVLAKESGQTQPKESTKTTGIPQTNLTDNKVDVTTADQKTTSADNTKSVVKATKPAEVHASKLEVKAFKLLIATKLLAQMADQVSAQAELQASANSNTLETDPKATNEQQVTQPAKVNTLKLDIKVNKLLLAAKLLSQAADKVSTQAELQASANSETLETTPEVTVDQQKSVGTTDETNQTDKVDTVSQKDQNVEVTKKTEEIKQVLQQIQLLLQNTIEKLQAILEGNQTSTKINNFIE